MATPPEATLSVAKHLKKTISEHDTLLAIHLAGWLRKRSKALQPKLSDEQKQQLEECFELMDADGSGAIDADELGAAFKLLGIPAKKGEIEAMLAEVDADGSGEVEYPEFIQIMTSTFSKLADKKDEAGNGNASSQVPFVLLATAYRRKRIMEGLISGDREQWEQVVGIAEDAQKRAAGDAATAAAAAEVHKQQQNQGTGSDALGPPGHPAAAKALLRAMNRTKCLRSVKSAAGEAASSNGRCSTLTGVVAAAAELGRTVSPLGNLGNSIGDAAAPAVAGVAAAGSGNGVFSSNGGGSSMFLHDDLLRDLAGVLGDSEHEQLAEVLKEQTRRQLQALATAAPQAAASSTGAISSCSGAIFDGTNSSSTRWQASNTVYGSSSGSSSGRAQFLNITSSLFGASTASAGGDKESVVKHTLRGSSIADDADSLVGFSQHMTSKLQERVLTQQIQLPKFSLTPSRSNASSPLGDHTNSSGRVTSNRTPAREPARSAANTPTTPLSPMAPPWNVSSSSNGAALVAAAAKPCSAVLNPGQMFLSSSSAGFDGGIFLSTVQPGLSDQSMAAATAVSVGPSAVVCSPVLRFADCTVHEHGSNRIVSAGLRPSMNHEHGFSSSTGRGGSGSGSSVSRGSLSGMLRSKSAGRLNVLGQVVPAEAAPYWGTDDNNSSKQYARLGSFFLGVTHR